MNVAATKRIGNLAAPGALVLCVVLALLMPRAAVADNVNAAGASLRLAGPAYWSHTIQSNPQGAQVFAVGAYDEGGAFTNAQNATLIINPIATQTPAEPGPEGEGEGEGEIPTEGEGETPTEGEDEGETPIEGEGEPGLFTHSADQDGDGVISLSELLRVIQFFNTGGYHCDATGESEDGYLPGDNPGARDCPPHASDYNPQDWVIDLSELLRLIQFFNTGAYHACPDEDTEDGYCPGPPPGG